MKRKQSPTKSLSFSYFRVISGIWRRRKLPFPQVEGLRPTPDRVRETLFNWLADELTGCHCLDLFAGSGALGFEALSRGAISATFIDSHRIAVSTIQQNLDHLESLQNHVVCGELPQALKQLTRTFDLIFIDPPYNKPELIKDIVNELQALRLISNNAWVYIETSKKTAFETTGTSLQLHREKVVGQVKSYLFTYVQ